MPKKSRSALSKEDGFIPLEVKDNRKKNRTPLTGFTFIEVFCVAVISSLIITAFFLALNTGGFSKSVSSAKVEVQSEVRRAMDWVAKDVRQAVSWDIADANNGPADTHIKFRQVQGWDTNAEALVLTDNYLEYTFEANSNTITRRQSDASNNTIQTWVLRDITQPPFYTRDNFGNVVPLNSGNLLTSRKLIIAIAGQKQINGSLNATAALTEEVKIRNE